MNNKKKAIKIATATAIVASGFVAVAPAQAAVSVADTVANAKKVMAIPYKTYTTASFLANPKVVEDQVKAAKTAYNNAVKVVNKSGGTKKAAYLSQLKTANVNVTRADGYTKAHRIAEKDKKTLEKDLASLNKSAVDQESIEVKDKYNAILKTVKTARTSIEKVYGTQVKLNLKSKFTDPTSKALEGDIKVYYFYQKAEAWLAKGEIETAEARVKEIAPLFEKVGKTTDLEKAIHAYAETVSKKIEDAKTPAVTGVSAINAKTVEITFNKAIKADSVIGAVGSDDTLENGVIKFDSVNGAPPITADAADAELSADGKTLTITATAAEYFNGKYAVTVSNSVSDTTGKALEAYSSLINVNDVTRPVVTGVTYDNAHTAIIKFSEPLKDDGSVTFNNASAVQNAFTAGDDFISVDLSAVAANQNVAVTVVGAFDYNGNLVSPNPLTVNVSKSTSDTVKPTVVATEALSLDKFKVTFSEKLLTAPTITVDGDIVVAGTATAGQKQGTVIADSTGLVYTVDLASDLAAGVHTVGVPTFLDKSSNPGDAYTKVLNFAADTTEPTVTSFEKQVISGKEYLVVNFSEDVAAQDDKDIIGTFVADYVTNSVTIVTDTNTTPSAGSGEVSATVTPVTGNTKAVKVDLSSLAAGNYNVNLPAGFVKDTAGVSSLAKAVSFTRTSDTDVNKPGLVAAYDTNGIQVDTNTSVTVKFDKKLDAPTALNKANYSIEGVTVSNVELIKNDTNEAIVRLTLADSSVSVNGLRNVTISSVKSAAGVVMDTVTKTENFTENVRPTITAATITANNQITLTFSESIDAATVAETTPVVDFDLYLANGTKYASTVVEARPTANTVTLTLNGTDVFSGADVTNGVVVKPAATSSVLDLNSNALSFTSITVK